jgi:alpha-glucuronidase
VVVWWEAKLAQIRDLMPSFGGFLVKADSEGNKGPQVFNRKTVELTPIWNVVATD